MDWWNALVPLPVTKLNDLYPHEFAGIAGIGHMRDKCTLRFIWIATIICSGPAITWMDQTKRPSIADRFNKKQ